MSEHRPRGSTANCVKCARKFNPGDRVITVFIVQKTGANPENLREFGAWLGGEFELVHADCANPSLSIGVITL